MTMLNRMGQVLGRITICLALTPLVGCSDSGPKLEPLSGQVMRDGKPMNNVSVAMIPVSSGLAAIGSADKSGNIQIQTNGKNGAMAGKYKVGITEPMRPMTPNRWRLGLRHLSVSTQSMKHRKRAE